MKPKADQFFPSSFLQGREEDVRKFTWYIIIGAITYVINNLFLLLFRQIYHMEDIFAVALSFFLTSVCHFLLHNKITFRDSKEKLRKKMTGHAMVSVANYFIGVAVATFVLRYIMDSNLFATACSTAATFLIGFVLLNRFVYKYQEKEKETP